MSNPEEQNQPQQEPSPNQKNCVTDEYSQTKAVSKEFAKAAKENIVAQIIGVAFFSLILDGGVTLNFWLISCLAYWAGFVFVRLRRPAAPSRCDLLFLHFGVIILFVVTILLAGLISLFLAGYPVTA